MGVNKNNYEQCYFTKTKNYKSVSIILSMLNPSASAL